MGLLLLPDRKRMKHLVQVMGATLLVTWFLTVLQVCRRLDTEGFCDGLCA